MVCTGLAMSVYAIMTCSNLRWSQVLHEVSYIPQICIVCEVVLNYQTACKACSRTAGTHSSKPWPYTGNFAKSKGWALFHVIEWVLFCEITVNGNLQWVFLIMCLVYTQNKPLCCVAAVTGLQWRQDATITRMPGIQSKFIDNVNILVETFFLGIRQFWQFQSSMHY